MESFSTERTSRQILIWLGAAERRLVTRLNRTLKGGGLPYAQFVVLNHLACLPAAAWTVSGLASALEKSKSQKVEKSKFSELAHFVRAS